MPIHECRQRLEAIIELENVFEKNKNTIIAINLRYLWENWRDENLGKYVGGPSKEEINQKIKKYTQYFTNRFNY